MHVTDLTSDNLLVANIEHSARAGPVRVIYCRILFTRMRQMKNRLHRVISSSRLLSVDNIPAVYILDAFRSYNEWPTPILLK